MARLADKYDLYLRSVQQPDVEVRFFHRAYRAAFGREPRILREDFCGTAAVSCEWVRGRPNRRAVGVDLDRKPLDWASEHHLGALGPAARGRVRLVRADARSVDGVKADIVAAQNFSFYVFHTRPELRAYCRAAHRNLARKGIFVLDMLGGYEVLHEGLEEPRRCRGFTYVWEQKRFDPITHRCEFAIHFRFPDGSEIRRAFVYRWRLWSIPEVREVLTEAGFSRVEVYWEGTVKRTGAGNGAYRSRQHAESDASWVAYVVGIKE